MAKWFYDKEPYTYQCSKCFKKIVHKYEPKRCPNCGAKMENAFITVFGKPKSQ